jgi:hypothetical protein
LALPPVSRNHTQVILAQLVERLIRNLPPFPYVIHSKFGVTRNHAAILAWRALIESDFESNFSFDTIPSWVAKIRPVRGAG